MNAADASFQSSLKLCTRAETQIWRTGEFGLTTNFAGGSSNSMESAPALLSTSKSCRSEARSSARCRDVSACSDRVRNSFSSTMKPTSAARAQPNGHLILDKADHPPSLLVKTADANDFSLFEEVTSAGKSWKA